MLAEAILCTTCKSCGTKAHETVLITSRSWPVCEYWIYQWAFFISWSGNIFIKIFTTLDGKRSSEATYVWGMQKFHVHILCRKHQLWQVLWNSVSHDQWMTEACCSTRKRHSLSCILMKVLFFSSWSRGSHLGHWKWNQLMMLNKRPASLSCLTWEFCRLSWWVLMGLNAIYGKVKCEMSLARGVSPGGGGGGGVKSHGALLVAKQFLQCCLLACGVMHPPTSPKGKHCTFPFTIRVSGAGWTAAGRTSRLLAGAPTSTTAWRLV